MESGIFLLLGTNVGDRFENLSEARKRLGNVLRSSSVYATAAWGNTRQPEFYNQVIEIESDLSPADLLKRIWDIEKEMGRIRDEKWGPRVIDIDILFYNDQVIKTDLLTVPHPEIQNRKFTLVPLSELTDMIHPLLKKNISKLLEECNDTLEVRRLPLQQ
jgi:2-amino-4-hydroxy-6-hydroxymethyldihydropteridine diphosphokinase